MIFFAGCNNQKKETAKRKPNVVFILADDFGYTDLGVMGSEYYETPNLDRIANEGTIFTQGYAACRVCSPSRASIMTGMFTARHGITDWIGAKSGEEWRKHNRQDKLLPAEYNHGLALDYVTLPEALKEEGYKTFFAGKWHLGDVGSYPEDHGFDINKGGHEKGSPPGGYFAPFKNPKLEDHELGENLSERLAKETVEFITQHKDSSFFAFLSFYAVHGPIQTTEEKWSKYRDKAEKLGIAEKGFEMERVIPIRTKQDNPVYAGLVESMDDAIGIVTKALDELGLAENTIVIFTSDNGGVASGDSFSTSNLPLRGGKGYQWEGGIREPFFVKVPWLNNAGMKNDVPVIATDLYPTILDLAGAKLRPQNHIDGVSLVPLLKGESIEERPLYWHYPHYGNQGGNPSSIIRKGDWKLIHYWENDNDELYNTSEDINERNDLAASQPKRVSDMRAQLLNWLKEMNANYPSEDTEYNVELAEKRRQHLITKTLPAKEAERLRYLSTDFDPKNNWWGSKVTED
ncbi:sulfatase [Reichenbachiella sp. MALMAid0571]|uniref:sulfatase n=1 Tax=Reichenbachiella sp. MALMAid0571 TaxID=3143939 RepID=UPI0032DF8CFE